MSTATKYDVIVNGEKVEQLPRKAAALHMADRERTKKRAAVKVVTTAGKVIYEKPAPKRIKQSPQYSRVVPLPTDVMIPDGLRVAYVRPRRNGAICHNSETGKYLIVDLTTGKPIKEQFDTARDAGDRLKDGVGKGAAANA